VGDHLHDRVKSLFLGAVDLPTDQRKRFLDERCEGDANLRARVEALLAAADGETARGPTVPAPGLLDSAPPSPPGLRATGGVPPIAEGPGSRIGPYKLLQRIGEGGFGSVFMAEQEHPIRRRVALKIIKPGMDSRQVIARFEAERQALALMDHPHIARVLDGGLTPELRPYFVMEYVVGDAINAFADAHRLIVRDRLELFAQVCQAVQHAHTKGIIHRDLKPSNVLVSMVDGRPFAKVIDFGIAKATGAAGGRLTDKTFFTEHRQLIGTPEYMSPEQAEGSPDIDTRTDVYGLGVLLYELLTGLTPFDGARLRSAAFAEMQRIIKEEEPPAPSLRLSRTLPTLASIAAARRIEPAKLGSTIKGELDWIVMKALDKDRARRYESANQLAADVQRHLAGEAVVAAPPSAMYRLRKFVRRNRGPVIAALAVAAAIVLGIIGTSTGLVMASRRADGERLARIEANADRETAEERTREAQRERDRAEAALREAAEAREGIERGAYIANINAAAAAHKLHQFDRVRQNLDACPSHLRGLEWHLLDTWSDTSIATLSPCHTLGTYYSDSRKLAFVQGCDGTVVGHSDESLTCSRWDARTGNVVGSFPATGGAVDVSESGHVLLTSDATQYCVWNTISGEQLCRFPTPGPNNFGAMLVAGGHQVLVWTTDGQLQYWDAHTGQQLRAHKIDPAILGGGTVWHCAPLSSSDCLYLQLHPRSQDYPRGYLYHTVTGAARALPKYSWSNFTREIASANGRIVLCAQGNALVYDIRAGTVIGTVVVEGGVSSAFLSADGSLVVAIGHTGDVSMWDVSKGKTLSLWRASIAKGLRAWLSPKSDRVAVAYDDGSIRVCRSDAPASYMELLGHTQVVNDIAWSPDGQLMCSGAPDGVKVWDLDRRDVVSTVASLEQGVTAMALSPDGATYAAAWRDDNRIWLTDTVAAKAVGVLQGHTSAIETLQFSNDGTRLLSTSSDGTARVWDTKNGRQLGMRAVDDRMPGVLAIMSSDGSHVVSRDGTTAIVWDASTGLEARRLVGHEYAVQAIVWTRDGTRCVTGSFDGSVRTWNVRTGECMQVLEQNNRSPVECVALDAEEKWLVVGTGDRLVRCWDLQSSTPKWESLGLDYPPSRVEWNQSGERVLVLTQDGKPVLLDGASGSRVADLRVGASGYLFGGRFACDGTRIVGSTYSSYVFLFDARAGSPLLEIDTRVAGGSRSQVSQNQLFIVESHYNEARTWYARPYRERYPEIKAAEQEAKVQEAWVRGVARTGAPLYEIRNRLFADGTLSRGTKIARLQAVDAVEQQLSDANTAVWNVVSRPGAELGKVRQALNDAIAGVQSVPGDEDMLGTLGTALYRAGDYEAALAMLTASEDQHIKEDGEPEPFNYAFIAIAHWQLGNKSEARAAYRMLRRIASGADWRNDKDLAAILEEVCQTLGDIGPDPSPLELLSSCK